MLRAIFRDENSRGAILSLYLHWFSNLESENTNHPPCDKSIEPTTTLIIWECEDWGLKWPGTKALPKTDIKNQKLRGKQIHYKNFKDMTKNKQHFITLARIKFVICIEKRFLTRRNFFCDNIINQAQTLSLKIFFEQWNDQHFQIRI